MMTSQNQVSKVINSTGIIFKRVIQFYCILSKWTKTVQHTWDLRHVHIETLPNMLMVFSRELSWFLISDVVSALSQAPWTTDKAARSHIKEQVTMNRWKGQERWNLIIFMYVHTNHVSDLLSKRISASYNSVIKGILTTIYARLKAQLDEFYFIYIYWEYFLFL